MTVYSVVCVCVWRVCVFVCVFVCVRTLATLKVCAHVRDGYGENEGVIQRAWAGVQSKNVTIKTKYSSMVQNTFNGIFLLLFDQFYLNLVKSWKVIISNVSYM